MIEKQIQIIYEQLKDNLLSVVNSDKFYAQFLNILRSGTREFSQLNVEVNKYIDEEWVLALERALPYMQAIIMNPRRFIKAEEDVMPVELARKINSNSVKHLASNTHLISRIDKHNNIIPSKILSSYNEESFDIYENRFVMTLLDRADQFVDMRFYMLGDRLGNEFCSDFGFKGKFQQDDEKTTFSLQMKIDQGAMYLGGEEESVNLMHRLEQVRTYLKGFRQSEFVRVMSRLPPIRKVNKTNLMMKSFNYKACYDLWMFMDEYTKVGYKIEVIETNPTPLPALMSESEILMLFNYLVFKNNMSAYQLARDTQVAESRKRIIEPKLKKRTSEMELPRVEIIDHKTLMDAIKGGQTEDSSQVIRDAILKALDVERETKEKREKREKENNDIISKALKGALADSEARRQREMDDMMGVVRNAEIATKLYDITDGGYSRGPSDRQVLNVLERSADALERLESNYNESEGDDYSLQEDSAAQDKDVPLEESVGSDRLNPRETVEFDDLMELFDSANADSEIPLSATPKPAKPGAKSTKPKK